jgi:hypothetical protein
LFALAGWRLAGWRAAGWRLAGGWRLSKPSLQQQQVTAQSMHYPASTQLAHWTFPASPAVLPETTLLVDKLARLVPLLLPAHPIRCTLTALAYVRRFFVHVSPDDADGLIVVLCAIYVAGKVEELPTPAGYLGNQRGALSLASPPARTTCSSAR